MPSISTRFTWFSSAWSEQQPDKLLVGGSNPSATTKKGSMHHKRKRPKQQRAGCLLCKPNKLGQGQEKKLGHVGFGNLRKDAAAANDLKFINEGE